MADNTVLSAAVGTGDTIATDDDGVAKHQYVKLEWGADNTFNKVSAGLELPVDPSDRAARDNGKVDIAVLDQLPTTDYDTGAGTQTVPMIGIGIPASGGTVPAGGTVNPFQVSLANTGANSVAIKVDGSAVTQPVSLAANQSVNMAQVAGTATDVNSGVKSAGTIRVVLATDQPQLTNKFLVTPDSVALPANQSVNVSQINAVTPLMGNGVTGTGSPRVTIASDNTAFSVNAVQSGTWTVQPGNTPNTTPWLETLVPTASGGLSDFHLIAAATTNANNVKASAGQVYGWNIFNNAAYNIYVKLHNTAGTPTAGTGVIFTIGVPAGGGSNIEVPTGIAFGTGIGLTIVKGIADADATAVAASDCSVDLHYK